MYIRASQELDRDERVELYHRAQEIVAENLPSSTQPSPSG